MIQEREIREPGSCTSKCHLGLDFVIWSRESAMRSALNRLAQGRGIPLETAGDGVRLIL